MTTFWLLAIGAYLLGAIPFGLLIGLARGVDIRTQGSQNIGATNTGRVLGKKWGYLCLALDILKGLTPALVASFLLIDANPDATALLRWIIVGLAAVIGHTFPIYLKFRGGKGVATTIGVSLGIYPYFALPMVAALLAYAAARYSTHIVAAGSLTLAVVFPASVFGYARWEGLAISQAWPLIAVSGLLGLLIIVRHAGNISRLIRGEEPAASSRPGKPTAE